jgi:hypothetical protein
MGGAGCSGGNRLDTRLQAGHQWRRHRLGARDTRDPTDVLQHIAQRARV